MLYKVAKNGISHISEVALTTLTAEGLYEVQDLSQWLASTPKLLSYRLDAPECPQIVGCEVPIAPEFRVDVLAIDADGTIVVCEVKRNENDPLYQGLQYCGRLFLMPTADLVSLIERHTHKSITDIQSELGLPDDSSLSELWEVGRRAVRLVIVAQDYPPASFQTARWLASTGVRISCIRFDCFKDANNLYMTPQQVLPSSETTESYALQREVQQRQSQIRTRNMFYSLISSGLLRKDEKVYSHDGKEIGVVRDGHIERLSDHSKCVNLWQLTDISASWSACVDRDGHKITIGELRQSTLSQTAQSKQASSVDVGLETQTLTAPTTRGDT